MPRPDNPLWISKWLLVCRNVWNHNFCIQMQLKTKPNVRLIWIDLNKKALLISWNVAACAPCLTIKAEVVAIWFTNSFYKGILIIRQSLVKNQAKWVVGAAGLSEEIRLWGSALPESLYGVCSNDIVPSKELSAKTVMFFPHYIIHKLSISILEQ